MKQKTSSSVKKRFYKTNGWKWKVMRAKAGHNHRLIPKTKERKVECWKCHELSSTNVKRLSNQLALI